MLCWLLSLASLKDELMKLSNQNNRSASIMDKIFNMATIDIMGMLNIMAVVDV
jgi:hypothetical protein